ncbi:MAG: 2-phosphosulfolactate phosphatase [Gemmatimonadetes bacterium]|nr:2-phosphosulfolactate phosphatase [Gemmatimonadota bacterium]
MKLSVHFTPTGVTPAVLAGKPVVVLDILRATTTIVAALANGAKAVFPAPTADEALKIAQNMGKGDRLLAGERRCLPIPGFDLGNSPLEMTAEAVGGKTIILATTNGTPALVASESGQPVIVAAVTNFSAVVEAARHAFAEAGELHIVCSGRERQFAIEDAYVAGRYARAALSGKSRSKKALEMNDAALAAIELVRRYGDNWSVPISAGAAAHDLLRLRFKADVLAASTPDQYDIVPVYDDRRVTASSRG